MSQLRYFGSAFRFYPRAVKTFVRWEIGSRVLFFATVVCALAVMPPEYKLAALLLAVIRYVVVAFEVRRIARRLGEAALQGVTSSTTCSARCGPRRWGRCCSAVTTAYGDSRLYRSRRP